MASFPRTENDILVLAEKLRVGLAANESVFPAPPVEVKNLATFIKDFEEARDVTVATQAAALEASATKADKLQELTDAIKRNLAYAENTANKDEDKLKLLGWSGRKEPTKLIAPGQPRNLEIESEGPGTITLDWKKPLPRTGGKTASYKIECRELPKGATPTSWQLKGMALDSEATLASLPQGTQLEFRVIAVNKAGDSEPSNTVSAVL